MFFAPFGDFGKVLVLLANVISFAEVDEIHNRLGGEEEEGIYDFDLVMAIRGAFENN